MGNQFNVRVPDLEGQLKLIVSRGGNRPGSGRKAIGETKTIKLTLHEDDWAYISQFGKSSSEAIRNIIKDHKGYSIGNDT